jgi:hypothetical protein
VDRARPFPYLAETVLDGFRGDRVRPVRGFFEAVA